MARPKVLVTHGKTPREGVELLLEKFDVEMSKNERALTRKELLCRVRGKDAIFCMFTDKIDSEVLDRAGSNLKVIGTMSAGYDHVDVAEAKRRGIKVGYTPDVVSDAVAEFTIGLLLAASRRILESHNEIMKGNWGVWCPAWLCGTSLKGKIVGIVGQGRIGKAVSLRLKAFGVAKIYYTGSRVRDEEAYMCLDKLLQTSDFVIVTCALTPKTKGLFSAEKFALMKPTAVFINTSRGAIVDLNALLGALESGALGAAGLDVTDPEPLPKDHPLLKLKNCIITPHIAGATTEVRVDMAMLTAKNIIAALEGAPMPAPL